MVLDFGPRSLAAREDEVVKVVEESWQGRRRHLDALVHAEFGFPVERVVFITRDVRDQMVSKLLYTAEVARASHAIAADGQAILARWVRLPGRRTDGTIPCRDRLSPAPARSGTLLMLRVLLAGAPSGCWNNVGDEAILRAMLHSLRAEFLEVEIAVVSSCPDGFLEGLGCEAVPFRDLAAVAGAVDVSDLVILGGGSIFFDYWGWDPATVLTPRHGGLALWAGLALLAAESGTPLMVYGAGVGPLRTQEGQLLTRTVFELADAACLRDPRAVRALDALGFVETHTTLTGDPAISLRLRSDSAVDVPKPWLGVALRQWDLGADSQQWQAQTAAGLDRHLERHPGTAVFISCHRRVSWPLTDDDAAADAVRSMMRHGDRTHAVRAERPWTERATLLASCDLMLAMRYHAALLAMSEGTPTVGLSYDPKVDGLFDDWAVEDLSVTLAEASASAVAVRLGSLADGHRDRLAALEVRAQALRERERRNVAEAVALMAAGARARPPGPATQQLVARLASDGVERGDAAAAALSRLRDASRPAPSRASSPTGHEAASPGIAADGRRRVAILTNRLLDRETGTPHIGGAERYARELGRLLRDLGLQPTFFQREGVWGEGDYFGFPVVALPRGEPYSEFEVGVAEAFYERTGDYDHVLCLMPNYASGPLREDAVAVCHGVWWDHECYTHLPIRSPEWYEHLERAFTRPRRVVSVDVNSINVVRALFPPAAERMTWIPSWVDTTTFHPPPARSTGPPLVLFPRRLDDIRGLRLAGPIVERVPNACRFVWVGDGPAGARLVLDDVATRDPRFAHRVATLDEMPDLYRQADIVVIPTIGSEGQSLACLEAMASGCAVVATRVGGLPELISDGVNGLLCEPNADAIAAAVRRLLDDSELRLGLGAHARHDSLRYALPTWRRRWAVVLAELGWVDEDVAGRVASEASSFEVDLAAGDGAFARRTPTLATRPATPLPSDGSTAFDVVCFSIIDWQHRWNRPQAMMTAWARRGRRVFYLSPVTDIQALGGAPLTVRPLGENVWEVRLALGAPFHLHSGTHPDGFAADGLSPLRALRDLFGITRAAAAVEAAGWFPLADAARDAFGWPLLYDCMDDWTQFPGIGSQTRLLELEERLVEEADCVVVSSGKLVERWAQRRSDVVLARNAADFDFFQAVAVGDPLPGIAGPVAGFIGAIAEWFDADLVADVARARPQVTFVLVGGVHRVEVAQLEALANVRFEGEQPYPRMPDYLRRFDVCLIPFRVCPTTDAMDVIKVHQYMCVGAPIVSTPIGEMAHYSEHLYLAADKDEFVRQLDRALAEHDPARRARRIEAAKRNTWDDRLDRIESALDASFDGRGVAAHELRALLRDQENRATALEDELARWRRSRAWRVAVRYRRCRRWVARRIRSRSRSSPA